MALLVARGGIHAVHWQVSFCIFSVFESPLVRYRKEIQCVNRFCTGIGGESALSLTIKPPKFTRDIGTSDIGTLHWLVFLNSWISSDVMWYLQGVQLEFAMWIHSRNKHRC